MYDKPVLGLDDCQAAMSAMIAAGKKSPDTPIAMAIVDGEGNLLSYARLDGASLRAQRNCIKKAYTCAVSRMDSAVWAQRTKEQGISMADLGDPNLVPLAGGVVVKKSENGPTLGGIGVGGLPGGGKDEEVARIGLKAMGF